MDISLNVLWSNSYQYISSKISDGLSPLEKKVVMIAIAYFSLATLGYFLYRCIWRTSTEEKVSHRNDIPHVRSPGLRDKKAEDKDKATLATVEVMKVQDNSDQLSGAQIAIQNADQLRSILDSSENETLIPNGQERTLYLNVRGQLQGMGRQNDSPVWLNEKEAIAYEIKIRMHKYQWEPSKQPAFELLVSLQRGKSLPDPIAAIVDATLQELNQLASGAFQMAKKLFPKDPPDDKHWLTIFSDPDVYSSATLLGEADASKEAPQKTPMDALPIAYFLPQQDDTDYLYDDVEDPPKQTPVDVQTPNDQPKIDDADLYGFDDLKSKLSDAILNLKDTPLTNLYLSDCDMITDQAFEHLNKMQFKKLDFSGCAKITDKALKHLRGTPLVQLNLSGDKLTDDDLKDHEDTP